MQNKLNLEQWNYSEYPNGSTCGNGKPELLMEKRLTRSC